MSHSKLIILDYVEEADPMNRGQIRTRVFVEEFKPRRLSINLSKANESNRQKLKSLAGGGVAMIPCREGMMNGVTFLQYLEGDIEIISLPPSSSNINPIQQIDSNSDIKKPILHAAKNVA